MLQEIDLDKCDGLSIFSAPFLIGWLLLGGVLIVLGCPDTVLIFVNSDIGKASIFASVGTVATFYIASKVGWEI